MTDIADCSVVARQISQSRFWPLSPCLLLLPTTSPRRTLRHPLPESSQALLSSMRGHLFTQIQPTRLDRRRLFRDHLPSHALHGLPADDPRQDAAGRRGLPRLGHRRIAHWRGKGTAQFGRNGQHGGGCGEGGEVRAENLWI
jgi:hypothetical protein